MYLPFFNENSLISLQIIYPIVIRNNTFFHCRKLFIKVKSRKKKMDSISFFNRRITILQSDVSMYTMIQKRSAIVSNQICVCNRSANS